MPTVLRAVILGAVCLATAAILVNSQIPNHHSPAGAQASACQYPDQRADCEMYVSGLIDTMNMVIVEGGADRATKMLCGNTKAPDLIAEFAQEARKAPEADTDEVLFRLLTTNHVCPRTDVQAYNPKSAGELIDLCHVGDMGFELCSQYQWGFLDALFFMAQRTKTQVFCGDMRMVDSSIVMLNSELEADSRLRSKPAVSVMLSVLQKHMPCPEAGK